MSVHHRIGKNAPLGGILATQLEGVCWDERYVSLPLGGLDKTLVVNDVLYSYQSIKPAVWPEEQRKW